MTTNKKIIRNFKRRVIVAPRRFMRWLDGVQVPSIVGSGTVSIPIWKAKSIRMPSGSFSAYLSVIFLTALWCLLFQSLVDIAGAIYKYFASGEFNTLVVTVIDKIVELIKTGEIQF